MKVAEGADSMVKQCERREEETERDGRNVGLLFFSCLGRACDGMNVGDLRRAYASVCLGTCMCS